MGPNSKDQGQKWSVRLEETSQMVISKGQHLAPESAASKPVPGTP